MRTLTDRVVVVTGASSGIGRATAVAFAREGARLALVDVDAEALETTRAEVAALGRAVSSHRVDVSDRDAMRALAEAVVTEHGAVHVVINNAGVTVTKSFEDHSWDDWDWVIGVNLEGVHNGCRVFLPHLRAVDEAHIVNISSLFGIYGVPGQSAYSASKFAVRGLSEALWEELAGTPIGVTVVHPGGVRTNIIHNARVADASVQKRVARGFEKLGTSPEDVAKKIVRAVRRGDRRLVVTPEAIVGDWLRRMFPVLSNRVVGARTRKMLNLP